MRLSVLVVLCTIATALDALRPGAQWVVRGSDIEWLDKVQVQPLNVEISQAILDCQNAPLPISLEDQVKNLQSQVDSLAAVVQVVATQTGVQVSVPASSVGL